MKFLNTFLSVSILFCYLISLTAQPSSSLDPRVYYPLNGDANDLSGNGLHATLHGAMAAMGANGQAGNALEFDGVDDYLFRDYVFDVINQPAISISAWFFVDDIDVANEFSGISFGKKTTGTISLRIRRDDSRVFQAIIASPLEDDYTDVRSAQIQYGRWYHVVGIFQDKNVQLWVNGVDQGGFSHEFDGVDLNELVNPDHLHIGRGFFDDDIERYFDGKLDEIRIYNRVLTGEEINSLHAEGMAPNIEKTLVEIEDGALFVNSNQSLILRGDDGKCYQIKINELGQLVHFQVMCPH